MSERRPTHMVASIVEPQRGKIGSCVIENLSRTGARLRLTDAAAVPSIFWLRILGDAELRYCGDIWRNESAVGIDFVAERAIQSAEEQARATRRRMRLVAQERPRTAHWASLTPRT
jgi:hypothetical protein